MILSPSPLQAGEINRAQLNCDKMLVFRENINMEKEKGN